MATRDFGFRKVEIEGRPVTCSVIECAKCNVQGRFKHVGGRKPTEAVEQYFRNHGWQVGGKARDDICPDCKDRAAAKVIAMPAPKGPQPEPPRDMSREDRRIIFAKLDDLYLEDKAGYVPPWTDAAVARDLGVPRAWVAEVREELFGPEGSNPEFEEYARQLGELRTEHGACAAELKALQDRIGRLEAALEALTQTARRIDRELGR